MKVWQNSFALQGLLNFGRKASGEETREKNGEKRVFAVAMVKQKSTTDIKPQLITIHNGGDASEGSERRVGVRCSLTTEVDAEVKWFRPVVESCNVLTIQVDELYNYHISPQKKFLFFC